MSFIAMRMNYLLFVGSQYFSFLLHVYGFLSVQQRQREKKKKKTTIRVTASNRISKNGPQYKSTIQCTTEKKEKMPTEKCQAKPKQTKTNRRQRIKRHKTCSHLIIISFGYRRYNTLYAFARSETCIRTY